MANKSYFAHTSPEGLDSWHWFKEAGYDFQSAGENLAVDFSDSADVERAWMNSPSHRDNILNGKYTEVGIATAIGIYQGRSTVFVVTMFGTPRKVAAASPAPKSEQPEFSTVPKNPTETATASNPSSVLGEQTETVPVVTEQTEYKEVTQTKPKETPAKQPVVAAKPAEQPGDQAVSVTPSVAVKSAQQPIGAIKRQSDDWQVLVTSPSTTLKYSYYLLALLVLLALAVDTGLEIKWHHRKRAATAGLMLAAMAGLFWYANVSMFSHAVVAEAGSAITQSL